MLAARLEGKVALVTGGSSGIGRATALCFAGEGAKVVVADVNNEGGHETAAMIRDNGGEAILVKTDVSEAAQVEEMIDKTVQTYGRLDCAFNNAAIWTWPASTVDCTESDWNRVIDVNLKGVWLCMKYEIEQMLKQGGGDIVNASSINSTVVAGNDCAYVASKHGVVGLTKTAAIEYARSGIRVNAVCPAKIQTPMTDAVIASGAESEARNAERLPIGRMGQPEEIAEAVVWLCSEAASFVTGHAMMVDGGFIAQ